MTKEEFSKSIRKLVELKKDAGKLNEALGRFDPEFFSHMSFGRYEELVVMALASAVDDTSDWIGYWLYELDCGKKDGKVTVDGVSLPMRTPEDLYECITHLTR